MAAGKRALPRRLLLFLERALLVVAIVALGWYVTSRLTTVIYQAWQNRSLDALRQEQQAQRDGRDVYLPPSTPFGRSGQAPGGAARVIPRRPLVGRIEVPRIGLSAIVREGVDDRTLDRAVGHVPETALPGEAGNVAFAGHRDTFFRPLRHVRAGDRIVVTTPEGEFDYVVRETRVVPPTDVSVLDPTPRPTLTLVTCHPFNFVGNAPNRFIVRAEQAQAAPATIAGPPRPPAPGMSLTPARHATAAAAVTAVAATSGHGRPAAARAQTNGQPVARKASVRKPVRSKSTGKDSEKDPKKEKRGGWRSILRLFR